MINRSLIFLSAQIFTVTFITLSFPADFGKNVQIKKDFKNMVLVGDFNGDQQKDTAVLLEIGKNSMPSKSCKLYDPWYGTAIKQGGEPLSIGIITSNTTLNKPSLTIVHDSAFFSTPIWSVKKTPIELVIKGTPEFKHWKESIPDLKNDAIVLGTEAGIDILIYWNGKEYFLFQPNEEP